MAATRIRSVEVEPLDIPLLEPFVIAIGRLDRVRNVLVTVVLENGVVGYGEAAPLEPINGEDQATVLATMRACVPRLVGRDVLAWRAIARDLAGIYGAQAAARTGLEMAVIDAAAKCQRVPLWRWLGGAGDPVITDISIPIVAADHAGRLASTIAARGAQTIKIKVGGDLQADVARVAAIHAAAPACALTLDANQGYVASGAVELIARLRAAGIPIALFEQPVHRHDRMGLRFVSEHAGVAVAADEAVVRASDVVELAALGACQVVNLKLMKGGLVEAFDIVAACRASHLGLMIGGMIESRLAMGCSAQIAAGLGGFTFIDLDTPLLLAEDPFEGGHRIDGVRYVLDDVVAGIGCWPRGRAPGFLP